MDVWDAHQWTRMARAYPKDANIDLIRIEM